MVKHLKLRFWGELLFEHNNRKHADFAVSNLLFEHKIQKQILPSLILILPLLMFSLKFVGNHKYPDINIKIQISQPNTLTRKKQTNKQKKTRQKVATNSTLMFVPFHSKSFEFISPSTEYRRNLAWLYWPSLHCRTHYSSGRTLFVSTNIRFSGYSSLLNSQPR